jgi:hypothetical protein
LVILQNNKTQGTRIKIKK